MSDQPASEAAAASGTERRSSLGGRRSVVLALLLALVLTVLVRSFVVDVFYIPSASMEPALQPGDRIAVWRWGDQTPRRGEVVVFDGSGSLAPYASGQHWWQQTGQAVGSWLGITSRDDVFVKRVIGVAGDTVSCCAADGRLQVNGQPLSEAYLPTGEKPSEQRFSVTVPEGRMWVMGDHRSASTDSRALLGAPGGGMIRTSAVIGTPVAVLWPMSRLGRFQG